MCRKGSGKIVQSKELFSISGDDKLEVEAYVHKDTSTQVEDDTEDIAANLTTFKIGKDFIFTYLIGIILTGKGLS